jgi:hypothetical protein
MVRGCAYQQWGGRSWRLPWCWRQYHHHGSIDDPDALRAYQQAIRG